MIFMSFDAQLFFHYINNIGTKKNDLCLNSLLFSLKNILKNDLINSKY